MSKPKSSKTIFPRAVSIDNESVKESVIENTVSIDVEKKIDDHIKDKSVHFDKEVRDAVTLLRKDVDHHTNNQNTHITKEERILWNDKETPSGSQSKANKVMNSLNIHTKDKSVHITTVEKESLKDKYTRGETRNLLKHSLTGLIFLEAVLSRFELDTKYPNPKFNSCVYIRKEKMTLIYNGTSWVEFNGIFTPDVTSETDGYMSNIEKIKLDGIEEGANNYIHPDNVDTRHTTDSEKTYWNEKADNTLASNLYDGLMKSEDKIRLDNIEDNANNYIHPDKHQASIIEQDTNHKFVTDSQIDSWDNKAEVEYVDKAASKSLSASKSFTDTKLASMFNSTEEQLQVLRSLAFELKKDDIVKQFFDLFNSCTKNKEFQDHSINNNIHISKHDRVLLTDIKEALDSGMNPDWNEANPSSLKYIENKPTSLPADGGDSDTVGGYTAEQLLTNKSFYDYTLGTSTYTMEEVSVLSKNESVTDTVESIVNLINKGKGYSVLFRPGSYPIEKELIIKASNTTFTGIGIISKLVGASIKIIGNNNIFENITLCNGKDNIVNSTAIYVEGNDNTIRSNIIMNYNEGIVVEGSNNTITNNTLVNIRTNCIKLVSELNSNYGNNVSDNCIRNSNIGISILSSKNSLTKNHIIKNKILNCSIGIVLSNTISDKTKTTFNIINENIVIRGRGEPSEYLQNHKTIISEFSSKNIISSNITSGKEIIAPNDCLSNNLH